MGKIIKNKIVYSGGGSSLPSGGTTGQVLAKKSNTDQDVEWKNIESSDNAFIINTDGTTLTADFNAAVSAGKSLWVKYGPLFPIAQHVPSLDGSITFYIAGHELIGYTFKANQYLEFMGASYNGLQIALTPGDGIEIDRNLWKISATIQAKTMPEPIRNLEGQIRQYVGETNGSYINGYFYECVEVTPSTDPKTYEWVQKNVQSGEVVVVDLDKGGYNADDFTQYLYPGGKILVFRSGLMGCTVASHGGEDMDGVWFYGLTGGATVNTYSLGRDSDTWSVHETRLAVSTRKGSFSNSIIGNGRLTFENIQQSTEYKQEITMPFINNKYLFDDEYTCQLTLVNAGQASASAYADTAIFATPEYNKCTVSLLSKTAAQSRADVAWTLMTDHSWKSIYPIVRTAPAQEVAGGWSTAYFRHYNAYPWQELFEALEYYEPWRCLQVFLTVNGETRRNVARFVPTSGWFGPSQQYPVQNEYGKFMPIFWWKNDSAFTGAKFLAASESIPDNQVFFTDATDHDITIVSSADKTLLGTFGSGSTGFFEKEQF